MINNIVLAGGTCLLDGFKARFIQEIQSHIGVILGWFLGQKNEKINPKLVRDFSRLFSTQNFKKMIFFACLWCDVKYDEFYDVVMRNMMSLWCVYDVVMWNLMSFMICDPFFVFQVRKSIKHWVPSETEYEL